MFKAQKLIVLFVILLAITGKLNAQNQKDIFIPDSRLYECFDKTYIKQLKDKNPALIVYYNYYLDNSFFISELPSEKINSNKIPKLKLLEKFKNSKTKIAKLNILKYDVKRYYDRNSYYRMGTSNKVVVFYSEKEFMIKYNKHRKSLGLVTK